MNQHPLITVIMPLYNVWEYLDVAIASVKQQTYPHFECLCLDDGSKNDMLERARALTADDARFTVHSFENAGVATSRNRGLALAKGEFIAFIDQDDCYHPKFLEEMLRLMTEHQADCVVAAFQEIHQLDAMADFLAQPLEKVASEVVNEPLRWVLSAKRDIYNVWQKLWRVSALKGVQFNPAIFGADDMVFTCETFAQFQRIVWCETPLYGYRMHNANVTSQNPSRYALSKCAACEALQASIAYYYPWRFRKFVLKHLSAVVKDYAKLTYPAEEHRAILNALAAALKTCHCKPWMWSLKKYLRYRAYQRQWK